MKTSFPESQAQSLRFLPRDRKTLDYILTRLAVNTSPERYDLLQELFEMHRTSVGFDPAVLSKGRFKRFKAFEIRQVLAELEQNLATILSSDEFSVTNDSGSRYKELFNQYLITIELLSAPPSKSLNDQIDDFCKQMMQEGAYELLLAFYRQAYHHFAGRNVRIDQVITDYNHLTETLDYRNAFTLSGLQTVRLVQDAYQGNITQEELLLHLNILQKLLLRATDPAGLFELKARAIRIALLLDKRVAHLSALTNDIFAARKKRIIQGEELEAELVCTAAMFNRNADMEQKLEVLAFQSLNKSLPPYFQIQTKLAEGLLHASSGQIAKAFIYINEAEHLLIKNSFRTINMKRAWMEVHALRVFMYIYNEVLHGMPYEKTEYQVSIQAIRDIGGEIRYARILADGMQAVLHCIKGEKEIGLTLVTEWLEVAENENAITAIMQAFSCLQQEKQSSKKLQTAIKNLKDLNELFYSDAFCNVLLKLSADAKK
jgi:hypothetical protein